MAYARRPVTLRRVIAFPLLGLIVWQTVTQAVSGLVVLARTADLRDLAASIEAGYKANVDYLSQFIRDNHLDNPSTDCGDANTRARLTVSLAALEAASLGYDASLIDSAAVTALLNVKHRIVCNPLDGNAWLQFAIVQVQSSGPSLSAIEALRLSYWAARAESWVIATRLPFATRLYLAGVSGFETEYLNDLRYFTDYAPGEEVAKTYVTTQQNIRFLLQPRIAAQPESRKRRIVEEIDRLGMVFEAR